MGSSRPCLPPSPAPSPLRHSSFIQVNNRTERHKKTERHAVTPLCKPSKPSSTSTAKCVEQPRRTYPSINALHMLVTSEGSGIKKPVNMRRSVGFLWRTQLNSFAQLNPSLQNLRILGSGQGRLLQRGRTRRREKCNMQMPQILSKNKMLQKRSSKFHIFKLQAVSPSFHKGVHRGPNHLRSSRFPVRLPTRPATRNSYCYHEHSNHTFT